jgi:hypothetical protein
VDLLITFNESAEGSFTEGYLRGRLVLLLSFSAMLIHLPVPQEDNLRLLQLSMPQPQRDHIIPQVCVPGYSFSVIRKEISPLRDLSNAGGTNSKWNDI